MHGFLSLSHLKPFAVGVGSSACLPTFFVDRPSLPRSLLCVAGSVLRVFCVFRVELKEIMEDVMDEDYKEG